MILEIYKHYKLKLIDQRVIHQLNVVDIHKNEISL
jgi:hypothetical protein